MRNPFGTNGWFKEAKVTIITPEGETYKGRSRVGRVTRKAYFHIIQKNDLLVYFWPDGYVVVVGKYVAMNPETGEYEEVPY